MREIKPGLAAVEALLQFAVGHGLMELWDVVQARNELFTLLRYAPEEVDEALFYQPDLRAENETATEILTALSDDYAARGYLAEDTTAACDQLEAAVMGLCMPRASEVATFFLLHYMDSPMKATDHFYQLCRAANYIQVDRIKKDQYWQTATEYGALEITVNLSKPEKDPRDIAAARDIPASSYPQCQLCLENVGFAGTRVWPARQNLRVIPMTLSEEPWYFQYSPYAYYQEHCIVFNERHEPMQITERTFERLIEFVNDFPHYFIGSNADLPIVGGSILSHDHFQGGRHVFPMEKAESYRTFTHKDYPAVALSLVKWPLSVIRLTALETAGEDNRVETERQMVALASDILHGWRAYSDTEAGILAASGSTPHNTITPIARYNQAHRLEMDLVLRNNRTTAEHPLGIFHPHAPWHHIKKENIGLIEVMGLAVLPGRLRGELAGIVPLLTGAETDIAAELAPHRPWIDTLIARHGTQHSPEIAEALLRDEVGHIFVNVLRDCGVFKDDPAGRKQFERFIYSLSESIH